MSFFREFPESEDPRQLLRPDAQVSTPWGTAGDGRPCDKCGGGGTVIYRCLSCLETGSRAECPSCGGRVEFRQGCPTCAGTAEIHSTTRSGVSVFPTLAGLYRYLVEREAELHGSVIVELEGEISDDPDIDADSGALLIHPSDVVTRRPVDDQRVEELRRRLAEY